MDFDRDKPEEQLSSSTRKRVAFDSNLENHEHVSVCESTVSLPEKDKVCEKEKREIFAKSNQSNPPSEDDSITSSVGSYPPNHRYQNCQESDNEVDELYEDSYFNDDSVEEQEDYSDYDEDIDDKNVCQEVCSESIPNEEPKTIGLMNRNVRETSVYVHHVLNPIENLSQWKAVKSKGTLPMKPQKENFGEEQEGLPRISFSSEPSFKQSLLSFNSKSHQPKNPNQEISVDASLSSWLDSTATNHTKSNPMGIETVTSEKSMSQSIEDRPILGALTLEELRQFSASNSARKSPSQSPDEMPIIGTVGTYWSHARSAPIKATPKK